MPAEDEVISKLQFIKELKFNKPISSKTKRKALLELKEKLLQKFPAADIILYGSKAKEDSEEFSDIDLLIFVDSKVPQN